jgi:hypothetical protein
MIIIKISGGLGNQLFQYAFGRALSLENKIEFIIDKSDYGTIFEPRDFLLDAFPIKCDNFYKTRRHRNPFVNKIYNFIKNINFFVKNVYNYREKFFHHDPSIKNLKFKKKNYYFDGYWQSFKYFKKYTKIIKKELSFKISENKFSKLDEIASDKGNLAIQIRGGDNRKEPSLSFHGLIGPNYFNRSIQNISKKLNIKKIFIFTDDIEYFHLIKNKINYNLELVSSVITKTPLEDFYYFQKFENKIISNSTFGWWSAFLSNSKNIIYPDKWFNKARHNTKDLFPDEWTMIET